MRRLLAILGALLLCCAALSAQESQGILTGAVRDSVGVLPGATVYLTQDSDEPLYWTVCGEEGDFRLAAPTGDYTLRVTFVGYETLEKALRVVPETTKLGTLTLERSATQLQTVVVEGRPVRVRLQPDGFSVDVTEMRRRANDALDLLKLVPRIRVTGDQIGVIGKERVLVKVGNVLQRVDASELSTILKGYDAGLIERVEVILQPSLRYDPEGNTAMIVLHTSTVFKEYMGGMVGTEEMYADESTYRYGGYGSLMYNHRGLFASIAPSANANGSSYDEQQQYRKEDYLYEVSTPSSGTFDYYGIRGVLQYDYSDKGIIGLTAAWNRRKTDNRFESQERVTAGAAPTVVVDNENTYTSTLPKVSATAYWETAFGAREHHAWAEVSYLDFTDSSQTDYAGRRRPESDPFLVYTEENELNTSGWILNNDYSFYLDDDHRYLLEAGVKASLSRTSNYRTHDESTSLYTPIHQRNKIRWDETVLTPYVSSTLRVSDRWWMRLGMRYPGVWSHLRQEDEQPSDLPEVSTYSDAWLPSGLIVFTPSRRHQITLGMQGDITYPQFAQLNPFRWQVSEHTFSQGNTELRPQRDYTAALGYTYGGVLSFRGRLTRDLGLISSVSAMEGPDVINYLDNAQDRLFLGTEADYYFDKWSWMSAYISGYWGRSKYTATNPDLRSETKSSEWGLDGYLSFNLKQDRTWTAFVSGSYTGRKETTVSTLEPQYSFDAGTTIFLLDRRLSLSIAGLNLFLAPFKGVSYRNGYSVAFDNMYDKPTLYVSVTFKLSKAKDRSTFRSTDATSSFERRF